MFGKPVLTMRRSLPVDYFKDCPLRRFRSAFSDYREKISGLSAIVSYSKNEKTMRNLHSTQISLRRFSNYFDVRTSSLLYAFLLVCLPLLATGQQAFSGVFHQTEESQIYLYDISWEELCSRNTQLGAEGFELTDVEAVPKGNQTRYWAIWKEGQQSTRIERAGGWENMLKLKHRMADEGWILQDVEGFLEEGSRETFLGIWIKGNKDHKVWKLDSWDGLLKQSEVLGRSYYQLTDIEAFRGEYGITNFLAVYQKLSPSERAFPIQTDNPDQFYQDKIRRTKSGYAIVDYETYQQNGITFLLGLYKKAAVKDNCRHRLDWTSFVAYQQFLGDSFKLIDIEISEGDGNFIAPPANTNRIDQMPNISQQVLRNEKTGAQGASCATANALIWLAQRGFPRLYDQQQGQAGYEALARRLAGDQYMKAAGTPGSDRYTVTEGLSNYILDQGYDIKEIAVRGVQPFDSQNLSPALRQYLRIDDQPDNTKLDFAKESLVGNSIALLQWGIYEADPQDSLNRDFNKVGERWATLVGYGLNEYGNENPNVLIVHSPTSGGEAPIYLSVKEVNNRIKLHRKAKLHISPRTSIPADGQPYLENALRVEGERFAIWENIIVVKLNEPAVAKSELLRQD